MKKMIAFIPIYVSYYLGHLSCNICIKFESDLFFNTYQKLILTSIDLDNWSNSNIWTKFENNEKL